MKMLAKAEKVQLHLGCGDKILPGFINVDVVRRPGVDRVIDLSDLQEFKDHSVDLIYASHHLEHFPTTHVPRLLAEYYRVLKPNGTLKIAVPDLDAIAETYAKYKDWFTPPHNPWLGLLYGGQDYAYNFHKTGFNFRWLKYLLEKAGFENICRFELSEEWGVQDDSFARKPFNTRLSLNVQATKGGSSGAVSKEFRYTFLETFLAFTERVLLKVEGRLVGLRLFLIRRRLKRIRL